MSGLKGKVIVWVPLVEYHPVHGMVRERKKTQRRTNLSTLPVSVATASGSLHVHALRSNIHTCQQEDEEL